LDGDAGDEIPGGEPGRGAVDNDLLDQNRSIGRTVTESYVEDTTNRVLPRYLMLTFEYMWR
jgi:hypothetical protein